MTEKGEKGIEIITKKFGIIKGMNLFKQVLSLPEEEAEVFLEEKGLKNWKDFFFPEATCPVYVMFTGDLPRKMSWIYYFGSWDFQNKRGIHCAMIRFLCKGKEKLVCNNKTIIEKGRIFYAGKYLPLSKKILLDLENGQIREEMFYKNSKFLFEGVKISNGLTVGFLLERPLLNTSFNRMFILHTYNRKLFEPVYISFPQVSIWKLKI
jgi:dolichyl-diphosphooligosaccharide--protein glycosyltransferase